ncbi:MAG TPA: cupin domain-containing protein [Candidatus Bathyarchaeota archaeon]|nr:cupin domain-containing protein [Candidatus Bathyarchaeota archaeon]
MKTTEWDKAPSLNPVPGVEISIIGNGMHATMCYIVIQPGGVVDWHTHPHEQMGTLIAGSGELTSGDETVRATPGAAWYIPPGERHRFVANGEEAAVIIETFAPARVDYVIQAR